MVVINPVAPLAIYSEKVRENVSFYLCIQAVLILNIHSNIAEFGRCMEKIFK